MLALGWQLNKTLREIGELDMREIAYWKAVTDDPRILQGFNPWKETDRRFAMVATLIARSGQLKKRDGGTFFPEDLFPMLKTPAKPPSKAQLLAEEKILQRKLSLWGHKKKTASVKKGPR